MESTRIPNGFVIMGDDGKPILTDIEDGKVDPESCVEIAGGNKSTNKPLSPYQVRFVHTVKGETSLLVKELATVVIANDDNQPIPALVLAKHKRLVPFIENLYAQYMQKFSK